MSIPTRVSIPRETLVFNKEARIPATKPNAGAEQEIQAIIDLTLRKVLEAEKVLLRALPYAKHLEEAGEYTRLHSVRQLPTLTQSIKSFCETEIGLVQQSLSIMSCNVRSRGYAGGEA